MKRIMRMLFTAVFMLAFFMIPHTAGANGIQLYYDGSTHMYTGSIYNLYVNGNAVHAALDPIIFNDHALVPVREVFEECGATVDYTVDTRCVEIQYNRTYIRLYINDNCAYVNGKRTQIPDNVVPKLINKPGDVTKTMVPVRFISETAGMAVEFDGDNGAIYIGSDGKSAVKPITMPEPTEPAATPTPAPTAAPTPEPINITRIDSTLLSDTKMKVTVTCDGNVKGKFAYFTLQNPERVVVDFNGMSFTGKANTIDTKDTGFNSVRTGVTPEHTRLVIDVDNLKSYSVKASTERVVVVTVEVTGEKPAAKPIPAPVQEPSGDPANAGQSASSYATGITKATAADAKKVIMLDAGHGGSDPGAIGTLNGRTINEKDLTLSITYKVKAILEANGYKTSMTRTGDTLPSLAERPEKANSEGCALFVSIHINSAAEAEAKGTEVYWSQENVDKDPDAAVNGKDFAAFVLNSMLKYMGSVNRGVRMADWAVTRRSDMPAILVEVGFISNADEVEKMCNDDYQNKTAKGIAEGIINMLHAM